ncbi:MAG: hypothetical protein ABFD04_03655 [Syntrophomonas sp.]
MIVLVVLGFVGFGYLQISSLAKKRWWRELVVFLVLWLSGFILSSLLTLGIEIPPVTTLIGKFLTGLLGA